MVNIVFTGKSHIEPHTLVSNTKMYQTFSIKNQVFKYAIRKSKHIII